MYDYETAPQHVSQYRFLYAAAYLILSQMTVPQSDVGTLMISGAESVSYISLPSRLLISYHRFIDGCDGVLIATPHAFETPETLEGLAKRMDGNIHVVGPMLASGGDTHGTERKQAAMAQEIDDFMGRIHETRGPKSLVYVRPCYENYSIPRTHEYLRRFPSALCGGRQSRKRYGLFWMS